MGLISCAPKFSEALGAPHDVGDARDLVDDLLAGFAGDGRAAAGRDQLLDRHEPDRVLQALLGGERSALSAGTSSLSSAFIRFLMSSPSSES
jgi:hypothetical protein